MKTTRLTSFCRNAVPVVAIGAAVAVAGCGDSASDDPDASSAPADAADTSIDASSQETDAAVPRADAADGIDGGSTGPSTEIVLFGGVDENFLDDTWRWDGESWEGEFTENEPGARRDHALVYDADSDRAVLFGGFDGSDFLNNTWEWDGETWRLADDDPPADLDGRSRHGLAYDAARGEAVLFGGSIDLPGVPEQFLDDTWLWDGDGWQESPFDAEIAGRAGHAMTYDEAREEVVLFGGDDGNDLGAARDTWVRDDTGWNNVSPPASESPPARRDHALAYDPVRERVVLFGGIGPSGDLNDTWEWNGERGVWEEAQDTGNPAARTGHTLVYDPARQKVILFGGTDADGDHLEQTLEWDGSQWQVVPGDDTNGPARSGHAVAPAPPSS